MSRASDSAYETIRGRISNGTLAPGAPLREEDLAEICGVSRTPVREALRRLEAELFVRRDQGSRAFVADWTADDVDEMFALRALLESHAAARAATRIEPAALEALNAVNARLIAAIEAPGGPDIAGFLACNRDFHDRVIDAAASPRLAAMLGQLIEQPVVRRTARLYDRTQLGRSAAEHGELLAAFARADSDWARAVMTGHIRRALHAFADRKD